MWRDVESFFCTRGHSQTTLMKGGGGFAKMSTIQHKAYIVKSSMKGNGSGSIIFEILSTQFVNGPQNYILTNAVHIFSEKLTKVRLENDWNLVRRKPAILLKSKQRSPLGIFFYFVNYWLKCRRPKYRKFPLHHWCRLLCMLLKNKNCTFKNWN